MKKSLYLLLLLLFPIGLQAQSEVIVLHPDEGKAEVNEAEYTRIFLAGTIDMGKSMQTMVCSASFSLKTMAIISATMMG